ncbi:hypothetical protein D3C85_1539310 [compost metagenome]
MLTANAANDPVEILKAEIKPHLFRTAAAPLNSAKHLIKAVSNRNEVRRILANIKTHDQGLSLRYLVGNLSL